MNVSPPVIQSVWLILQVGMQPIHTAASSGQPEVILMLTQEFGVDPNEKADVSMSFKS